MQKMGYTRRLISVIKQNTPNIKISRAQLISFYESTKNDLQINYEIEDIKSFNIGSNSYSRMILGDKMILNLIEIRELPGLASVNERVRTRFINKFGIQKTVEKKLPAKVFVNKSGRWDINLQ